MNPNPQEHTTTVQPLKAIIHGPPAAGKTKLAQRLCKLYGAHYVNVRTMIDEILEDLVGDTSIFPLCLIYSLKTPECA